MDTCIHNWKHDASIYTPEHERFLSSWVLFTIWVLLWHTCMREPVINFPCKWRGRIRIPIQYIPIKIHSEFVRIKPCIAAQPSLQNYQTTVSPHVSACLCVHPQPATRRSFFLYMLVVDVFGIRNSSMKEGRMCWFLEASTQDGPVAAKAHAHTPGLWWWCSWEEHDACCQLQKL